MIADDDADEADNVDQSPDDDDETTTPCPYCGCPIYEDSPRCPHCEKYLSEEDTASPRKPWWIIAGVLLVFYAIYRWIAG